MLWHQLRTEQQKVEDDEEVCLVVVAIALEGLQVRNQRLHRFYLTRASLAHPRADTAWQVLYRSQINKAFIVTMGINTSLFHELATKFAQLWDHEVIVRTDVRDGKKYCGRRSLGAEGVLGLILHYLNSTMSSYSLQQIFGLTPAVCSRYLRNGLPTLLRVLICDKNAHIMWPTEHEMEYLSSLIRAKYPRVKHAIGFVDGVHLPVFSTANSEMQNAYYNGWCSSHFTSNIFCFSPQGRIICCALNAPGSWHDSNVATGFYRKLLNNTPDPYFVVADTAFPRSEALLKNKIKTPLKSDFKWPESRTACIELKLDHEQIISARQAAEWGMHALQGSFGRLKMPLSITDIEFRSNVLMVYTRLHQLRVSIVGVNQIRNVYEHAWRDYCDEVYEDFANMMFKDIQKNDRIARYYNICI